MPVRACVCVFFTSQIIEFRAYWYYKHISGRACAGVREKEIERDGDR